MTVATRARLTHTVTQTAPDGTEEQAKFWDCDDASVQQWARDMRGDNPDYRYSVTRVDGE